MRSIRFKLWSGMVLLVLIMLLLLWLFQIVFLEKFYVNTHISDIKDEVNAILKLKSSQNKSEFENKLEKFAFENNLSVELIDSEGNSIYTAGTTGNSGQMPMMNNSERVNSYNKAINGQETATSLTHPRFGNKFVLFGIPIKEFGKISGVVLLNMPVAAVDETVSILKRQLIYITIVLLAATLAVSFIISRSFTRPILDIKKSLERMASGDFEVRMDLKKRDEIGDLSGTINYLAQQLSKIEKLRKDLIANVSHELRTPLSLIRGYAETIRDVTGENAEKREKHLGIIIEETDRLSNLVDDILNLSQLQAGHCELNKRKFYLGDLLDIVLKRYEVLSEKTGIKLVKEGMDDVFLEADAGRIEQVMYNLVNNAFNHTEERGLIVLRIVKHLSIVRIEVEDNGKGMSEDEIVHIWDKYYRADKSSDKKTVGTGLGLAIVKEILEAHNSKYGVESKKDLGTKFWFEIECV